MTGRYLPINDIYPGFFLDRIGHSKEFERHQIDLFLQYLELDPSDHNAKHCFELIATSILFLQKKSPKEYMKFEEVYEPEIGTLYPLIIEAGKFLTGLIIKRLLISGYKKVKDLKTKSEKKTSSSKTLEDLSPKEKEILLEIYNKAIDNKEFSQKFNSILKSWNIDQIS